VLYADDTSLIITNLTPMEFANKIHIVFANVNEWYRNKLLSLNFNKTLACSFEKRSQKLDLNITFLFFNIFHPEVFDTYIYTKHHCSVKHNSHLVCYLLTLGTLGDMFRFTWNDHQAPLKNIDPLHIIIKMRYGIPYAYNEFKFVIVIVIYLLSIHPR